MRAILDPGVERRTVSPAQARLAVGAFFAAVVALAAFEPWTARKADAMSPEKTRFFEAAGAKQEISSPCPEKAKHKTTAEETRKEEPAPASPAVESGGSTEESADGVAGLPQTPPARIAWRFLPATWRAPVAVRQGC